MPRNKSAGETVNRKVFQISSFVVVDQNAHFGSEFQIRANKRIIKFQKFIR